MFYSLLIFHVFICVCVLGEVYTWGDNDEGQLGDGSTNAIQRPRLVPALTGSMTFCFYIYFLFCHCYIVNIWCIEQVFHNTYRLFFRKINFKLYEILTALSFIELSHLCVTELWFLFN